MIPYFTGTFAQFQAVIAKMGVDWLVYCVDGDSLVWRVYAIHGTAEIWFDFKPMPLESAVLAAFAGKAIRVEYIQCSEQGMVEGFYQVPLT